MKTTAEMIINKTEREMEKEFLEEFVAWKSRYDGLRPSNWEILLAEFCCKCYNNYAQDKAHIVFKKK